VDYKSLQAKAGELGFDHLGLIPARPARRLDAYLEWVDQEMHGQMGNLARPDRVARRRDLNVILPGVQTIICVGLSYYTAQLPAAIAMDPGRGRISNYAWNLDYHDIMTPRLQLLAEWLASQSDESIVNKVYVDTGAILERDHAETAGLGFIGKNSMLINPRRGSYFFLGEILTTLPITAVQLPLTNQQQPSCGSCHRCLDICPTNAFPRPYLLDARRCISYLTIELKGWIPRDLRPLMGNWIYGCDLCQDVCPFNRFTQPTRESAFLPDLAFAEAAPPLLDILMLDERTFQSRFAHSPIKRIKRTRLIRNACVAAGNWGSETAVPALCALLADRDPIIRGHAVWALRQIGGDTAQQALVTLRSIERDEMVLEEINVD